MTIAALYPYHFCAAGDGHKVTCPPAVKSSQVSLAAPSGWVGWYRPNGVVKLVGAGVLLGPVQLNGEMKGEVEERKDGTFVNRFVLTGGTTPQLEKWMACNYGSSFFQAIQLPTSTRECEVAYRRDPSSPKAKPEYVVADITCR